MAGSRGIEIASQVRTIDIVPGLLDLLGVAAATGLHGESLAPLLAGSARAGSRHAYSESVAIEQQYGWSALYSLSTAVEPPAPHVAEGLITVTKDEQGQPFDWTKFTGEVLRIRSQKEHPASAAVAVKYRGWWFYIADSDQNSKITFSLLNTLFQLQAASGSGKSPVLTLPVGG